MPCVDRQKIYRASKVPPPLRDAKPVAPIHVLNGTNIDREPPGQYVEVSFKVSERAYTAWPERIRQAFEPARTVRTGRQTFKLSIKAEGI